MTKNDMVAEIAKRMNMPQTDVKRIVQMVLDGITEVLVTEGRLELRNFGIFEMKSRKPRKARNPKTGETVMVPARKAVTFTAGKFMKDRVNGVVGPADSDTASGDEGAPAAGKPKEEGEFSS
jgi:nucleoid DNA-binding protein